MQWGMKKSFNVEVIKCYMKNLKWSCTFQIWFLLFALCKSFKFIIIKFKKVQVCNWNFIGDRLRHCKENCGFAQPEWGVCWPSLLSRRCHQIPDVCKAVQTKGTDELPNGRCQKQVLPSNFLDCKLFYVLLVDQCWCTGVYDWGV